MRTTTWTIALLAILTAGVVNAQDLTGDWQGTLAIGARTFRMLVHLEKAPGGAWNATFDNIDRSVDLGILTPVESIAVQGRNVKFAQAPSRGGGNYEGTISADGNSIAGTWKQNQRQLPLEFKRATPATAWGHPATHSVRFVTVDKDVKLEVLDWGGSSGARPLVMLAGGGATAHSLDAFAAKLANQYHVWGITRRGFGASSAVTGGISADRLADDVLAVIDALKITKPVLVGHSIAGQEMSSIGSRHPERVAGLVYLDSGYAYAFYDKSRGDAYIDALEVRRKLEQLQCCGPTQDPKVVRDLLDTLLPQLEKSLKTQQALGTPPPPQTGSQIGAANQVIIDAQQKYTSIPVPILAIYAIPHDPPAFPGLERAAQDALEEATAGAQATAFERGLPSARVVRIPHADHWVFRSNEADVLREMTAFIAGLK